jgi:PAS domain S-box-containing protein
LEYDTTNNSKAMTMSEKPTYEALEQRIRELEHIQSTHQKPGNTLQPNKERFRAIFQQAFLGVAQVVSKTGGFLLINQKHADILGYAVEEMEHLTFQEITHPDDLQEDLDNMQRLLNGKIREFSMEKRYYHKAGSIVWVNLMVFPMWEIGETPSFHIAVVDDITERKRTEEALRESEEKYRSLIHKIQAAVIVHDHDTRIIACNIKAEELMGLTRDQLMGETAISTKWQFFNSGGEKMPVQEYPVNQVMVTRQPQKDIVIGIHRPGNRDPVWALVYADPLFDDKGHLKQVIVTFVDITDRKQMEERLRKSTHNLSEAQKLAQVGSWDWNLQTNEIEWSHEVYHIFGVDPEHFRPRIDSLMKRFHPDDRKKNKELIKRLNANKESYSFEARILLPDGTVREVISTAQGRYDNEEQLIRVLGTVHNITDRKQAEEEKRIALEFAANQSRRALIGRVAGKMAHDFNNVLMGIMGNAQLAIMDCDDENIRVKLERINEFALRGGDITSTLISYSIDQEPKQTYFKIENKIELVLKMIEKDLAEIKVSRNYKPGIPELLADPGMIQDALVNIIQNSIHAMSKVTNPMLNLKAYSQDGKVYVEVEDNGCGIPKEHQDSVYTPAFTLKGSHDETESYKFGITGTGYGMSNAKKYIVEKHKGKITLESEFGKGTRITIALKVIKGHLSSDEKEEVVKNQIFEKRRILLVEDEPAIADVQYQILTKAPFGHIVSIAANGQTAIDIFDRNKFDVVSLDYMLPGVINGLDVYHHIRENHKDIPVMFISGNVEFLESMKILKEKDPHLGHLSKPVDNLDYVNKINELIGSNT